MFTIEEITSSQLLTDNAKQWAKENLEYLNKPLKTLFSQSVKTRKGSQDYEVHVMYLQPADKVASKTLCSFADLAGCKNPCLISSGHLGMTPAQNACTKRTIYFLLRKDLFERMLLAEIDQKDIASTMAGKKALFRLNGTSDIDWLHIIEQKPQVSFYYYTKELGYIRRNNLDNYDLTFSGSMFSKQSRSAFKKAISRGHRIAVAFNTKESKKDPLNIPSNLESFDKDALRPINGLGIVGTLSRKGSSIAERLEENSKKDSFFVTSANLIEFKEIITGA